MNIVMTKEGDKYKAQVNCPVPNCTLKLHLFMDVKVLKNGYASRWVLSNFKKHINNHIFKAAQSSSSASTPSIATLFHRQAKKHKLDGAVDEQNQSVSPNDSSGFQRIPNDREEEVEAIVEEIDGVYYEVENVERDIFLQSQGQLGEAQGKVLSEQ
jgi:hypothetical protein